MKEFYQYKNQYRLPSPIYRKTLYHIKCYNLFKRELNKIDSTSDINIKDIDVISKVDVKRYIKVIDDVLKREIDERYREAVFLSLTESIKINTLAEQFYLSETQIKKWKQKYIFFVAKELGWLIGRE